MEMKWKWLFLLLAAPSVFSAPGTASDSKTKCDSTVETSDMPIIKNTYRSWSRERNEPRGIGPRLDAEMYYWDRGGLFRFQYGYFNPWFVSHFSKDVEFPNREDYLTNLAINSENTGYDPKTGLYNPALQKGRDAGSSTPAISFWMPSLRYVEHNMRVGSGFHPHEPGREPPSRDEYVVKFKVLWPGVPGVEQSPWVRGFENRRKRMFKTSGDFLRFDDEYFLTLHCAFKKGVNALCHGEIWDRERDYILFMMFPKHVRDSGPNFWRGPFDAAVELLDSWKRNAENE